MTSAAQPAEDANPDYSQLGGRLPLLTPAELDPERARLRDRLVATRGADARAAGFLLELPGGEVTVQQVTILTLGAAWHSDYEVYAHAAEARHAGVPGHAVDAIVAGQPPAGLSKAAGIAHRLTAALAVDHAVGDDLYAEAHRAFGTEPLIALVNLIGRYMNTAALLACFRVPAPPA